MKLHPLYLLLSLAAASGLCADSFVPLPTDSKITTVAVSIHAPLGLRYRPGVLFPLDAAIDNPGPAATVEISIVESGGSSVVGPVALPAGRSRFALAAHGGTVTAAATLFIHALAGESKTELFRASLSKIFQPLSDEGRIILSLGRAAPHGPADSLVQLQTFPDAPWKWEPADWLVVDDDSFGSVSPESASALTAWLSNGGRIFLGSKAALSSAVRAGLLPVISQAEIGSDVGWWEKNAGLTAGDILASKNFRPVYARLRRGLGEIVFLFPGSEPTDADGASVFNLPSLRRVRPRFDDRVRPECFAALTPEALAVPRRSTTAWWTLAGAALLCAALCLAHGSRTRIEALLVPAGAGALLAALLANGFPVPALQQSRVQIHTIPVGFRPQSTVRRIEEWTALSAFDHTLTASLSALPDTVLTPIYPDSDALNDAAVRQSVDGSHPLLHMPVTSDRIVMVHARRVELHALPGLARETFRIDSSHSIQPPLGSPAHALFVAADRPLRLFARSGAEYSSQHFDPAAVRTDNTLAALELTALQATALHWLIEDAAREHSERWIAWGGDYADESPLIQIEGETPLARVPVLKVFVHPR